MPKGKLRLLIGVFAVLLIALYYALLITLSKPAVIEKELVRTVESMTGGKFQSQGFKLSYFPTLQSEFSGASLLIPGAGELAFRAEKVNFRFGFLAILLKRANLTSIEIEEGSVHVSLVPAGFARSVDINHLKLKARLLRSFSRIQLQWQGDLEGIQKSFSGKSIIGIGNPGKPDWKDISIGGDVNLKEFPLTYLKGSFLDAQHIQIKEGLANGQFHLQKEAQDPWVFAKGRAQLINFIYEIQTDTDRALSPAVNTDLDLEFGCQPLEQQFSLMKSVLTMPFGKVQVSGRYLANSREIKEMRFTFSDLMLELFPQYYLPFREAVPFNLGFSGKSNLEMTTEGSLDKLSFHGNWDLSTTFLSYADFFSKPKDIPCNLGFDLLLKNNEILAGDFSLKLNDAGFKGALANYNIRKGEGDLNIISNKFLLERWLPLLPALSGYGLSGEIKLLANFSGNLFDHPQDVKMMLNVIVEKGQLSKGADSLNGIYFAMDYSPISLEVKQGQVLAGKSPLFFNMTVFDPKTQPLLKMNLHSDQADLTKLLNAADNLGGKLIPSEAGKMVRQLKPLTQLMLPEGQTVNNFQMDLEMKANEITVNDLKGQAYDGDFHAVGKVTPGAADKLYAGELGIDHLSLAKFFDRNPSVPNLMHGNFFLKSSFQGKSLDPEHWRETFSGSGIVSMTNGEFNSFSVMNTLSGVSGLAALAAKAVDVTGFDDFQADFKAENGKFTSEKISMISSEIKAEGSGEISFDGILNYRINAYLSVPAIKDVLGPDFGGSSESQGDYLGPIPMLLSGEAHQPELKTDPSGIAEFTENFAKKKTQKVLRTFLPEDLLFKRPTKS